MFNSIVKDFFNGFLNNLNDIKVYFRSVEIIYAQKSKAIVHQPTEYLQPLCKW